jgi:uncharacterized membrane protein
MSLTDILKGKLLGHPLHPIFVHIPVGLWPAALIFDLLSRWGIGGNSMVRLSFLCIAMGLVVALLAVPTGIADWSGIKKENPAWKIGVWHMGLNLVVAVLFALNLGLRAKTFRSAEMVETTSVAISAIAVAILFIAAYLGGLMVYDRGISVGRLSKKKWRKITERGGANVPKEKTS